VSQEIREELTSTAKDICKLVTLRSADLYPNAVCCSGAKSKTPNPDAIRKSLGFETFINDIKQANEKATSSAQRQGSRTWEPLIKKQLCPQYAQAAAQKGPGMYKRMKASWQYASNLQSLIRLF
jgi:hypothetical protein